MFPIQSTVEIQFVWLNVKLILYGLELKIVQSNQKAQNELKIFSMIFIRSAVSVANWLQKLIVKAQEKTTWRACKYIKP